jgi:hypothetical protein
MKWASLFQNKFFYVAVMSVVGVATLTTVLVIEVTKDSPVDTTTANPGITPPDEGSGDEGSGDEGSGSSAIELSKILQSLNLKPVVFDVENEEDLVSEGFIRLNHK